MIFPHAKSAFEGVRVVAQSAQGRQLLQPFGVAAAEHDVVGLECCNQALKHVFDVLPPSLPAKLFKGAGTNIVLVRAFLVWKMREFHRLHYAVDDQSRTEAGPETEKQHLA